MEQNSSQKNMKNFVEGMAYCINEPYNPQKNGAAEQFEQTLKRRLEEMQNDEGDIQENLY